tara:strand:+ start:98 stop:367 length:270 start_codon:yes stop_codon:yes gene_type:complete
MLRLLLISVLLFSASHASADECEAACQFVEEATGESCEDVAEVLGEIENYCGENEECWVEAVVEGAEGEWSWDEAAEFLEILYDFDCDA